MPHGPSTPRAKRVERFGCAIREEGREASTCFGIASRSNSQGQAPGKVLIEELAPCFPTSRLHALAASRWPRRAPLEIAKIQRTTKVRTVSRRAKNAPLPFGAGFLRQIDDCVHPRLLQCPSSRSMTIWDIIHDLGFYKSGQTAAPARRACALPLMHTIVNLVHISRLERHRRPSTDPAGAARRGRLAERAGGAHGRPSAGPAGAARWSHPAGTLGGAHGRPSTGPARAVRRGRPSERAGGAGEPGCRAAWRPRPRPRI